MNIVDLHVHSNCSDGTFSPRELVDYAMEKGLSAFALTDHDTVNGLTEAIHYAKMLRVQSGSNVLTVPDDSSILHPAQSDRSILPQAQSGSTRLIPEVIPGIELSTEYQGKDVHIVGLYINYENAAFQKKLQEFVDSRTVRNQEMCRLLQGAGIDITYEKLETEFPGCVITRAHYARYLLKHGYINNLQEAFERYVGDHCPYFVPRKKVTPTQAIELILEADGIPVLAHPILYHLSDARLDALVAECKAAGLLGIEAVYSTYTPAEERQIRRLADKYHLLISGGSDFHGANKPGLDLGCGYGKLVVCEDILNRIKAARTNLLFTDMDGTLLNNKSEISPAMKAGLDRMTAAGHHLILSSGRPLPSILEVREKLGITYPNMLIISNNGALVYDCDSASNILVHRLEMEDIRYIIGEAEKQKLHIHAYTDTEIVCHGMNDELRFYTRRIHLPLKCVENIADSLTQGSFKLQAIHLTDRKVLEDFKAHILPHLGGRVQLIFSNDQYLEILPASAGKGSALRYVEKYLHAPHSHTFSAGDAENDISMLKAAHTGIAMANAADVVKAAADIITEKDNDHDGLLEIIDKYFQSNTPQQAT